MNSPYYLWQIKIYCCFFCYFNPGRNSWGHDKQELWRCGMQFDTVIFFNPECIIENLHCSLLFSLLSAKRVIIPRDQGSPPRHYNKMQTEKSFVDNISKYTIYWVLFRYSSNEEMCLRLIAKCSACMIWRGLVSPNFDQITCVLVILIKS